MFSIRVGAGTLLAPYSGRTTPCATGPWPSSCSPWTSRRSACSSSSPSSSASSPPILTHPALAAPIAAEVHGASAYLVQEFVAADSVDLVIRGCGAAPPVDALAGGGPAVPVRSTSRRRSRSATAVFTRATSCCPRRYPADGHRRRAGARADRRRRAGAPAVAAASASPAVNGIAGPTCSALAALVLRAAGERAASAAAWRASPRQPQRHSWAPTIYEHAARRLQARAFAERSGVALRDRARIRPKRSGRRVSGCIAAAGDDHHAGGGSQRAAGRRGRRLRRAGTRRSSRGRRAPPAIPVPRAPPSHAAAVCSTGEPEIDLPISVVMAADDARFADVDVAPAGSVPDTEASDPGTRTYLDFGRDDTARIDPTATSRRLSCRSPSRRGLRYAADVADVAERHHSRSRASMAPVVLRARGGPHHWIRGRLRRRHAPAARARRPRRRQPRRRRRGAGVLESPVAASPPG